MEIRVWHCGLRVNVFNYFIKLIIAYGHGVRRFGQRMVVNDGIRNLDPKGNHLEVSCIRGRGH